MQGALILEPAIKKNAKPVFNFSDPASFSYLPGAAGVFLPSSRRHNEADVMSEASKWPDWLLESHFSHTEEVCG